MSENVALLEFQNKCRTYLDSLDIGTVRAYARHIGVANPTQLKKDELLDATVSVLSGLTMPIPRSSRGAPIKGGYIPQEIVKQIGEFEFEYLQNAGDDYLSLRIRLKHKEWSRMLLEFAEPTVQGGETDNQDFKGQVAEIQGFYRVFDLEDPRTAKSWILPKDVVEKYALRHGDVLKCKGSTNNSVLIPKVVESVNDLPPKDLQRISFDEAQVVPQVQALHFSNAIATANESAKFVEWILPPCKGQRIAVVAQPKTGKSRLLYALIQELQERAKTNPLVKPIVLLVDQTPETLIRYQNLLGYEQLSFSSYEDDPEKQVAIANLALERAKRYAECGYEIVLFVDSFTALARAYNDTKYSEGGKTIVGDLESKTLQYLKRFMATSRAFEKGSLTIIGTVANGTGNEVDEVLASELASWSNAEWRLCGAFANGQAFPIFDLEHSKISYSYLEVDDDDILNLQSEAMRWSSEDLMHLLSSCSSYAEFFERIQENR